MLCKKSNALVSARLLKFSILIMAKGFCKITHGDVNGKYYGRDKECLMAVDSDGLTETSMLSEKWQNVTSDEKLGNKEKGIKGRHDARVATNMILSMPNEYTPGQCLKAIESILAQTPAKDCYWSAWVHKGVKNGVVNQHVHLSINERLKSTGKKDREMQRKGWFENVFLKIYRKELEIPLKNAPERATRERVSMELVQSHPFLFREAVAALNEEKSKIVKIAPKIIQDGEKINSKKPFIRR